MVSKELLTKNKTKPMKKVCLFIALNIEGVGLGKVVTHGVPLEENEDLYDKVALIVKQSLDRISPNKDWVNVTRKRDIKSIVFLNKDNEIATAEAEQHNHGEEQKFEPDEDYLKELKDLFKQVMKAKCDPRAN